MTGEQPAKRLLQDHGMSVVGLARRYGINAAHLRHVLNGDTAPSHEVQVALTQVLRMPVTELFTAEVLSKTFRLRRTSGVLAPARG